MEPLTKMPPLGWPKAININGLLYRISSSRRRWAHEAGFYGRGRGVYYRANRRFARYLYMPLTEAQANIAPEALPKWLRVSEGL